jgi:hypothetical protein
MTRLGVVFWFVLVLVAGFTTFKVKYAVQDIEDQLNRVRRHTIAEQQEIRVLTAEWTFLNQPERLAELNRRFLQLAPIAAKQMQRGIADIPLRAPAAPAIPPDAPPDALPDVLTRASLDQAAPPPAAALPVTPAAAPAPASPLPVTPAAILPAPSPAGTRPAARVQLAKAGTGPEPGALDALIAKADRTPAPGGLDALISQIADTR